MEQNKAVYREFIQRVFNEGHLDMLDKFLAPSYVIRDAPPGTPPGAEGVKQVVSMFREAFPDFEITLDEVIAEGDFVAASSTVRGTHRGEIFGIPATGNRVSISSLTMVRIIDGRLVESRVKNDTAALMSQLGSAR
ncbi:MAG TPA: ester cyclase [Dehalococcoidia bacterium]|nr:ester cyclase [Dehalococcoidia bacterium]